MHKNNYLGSCLCGQVEFKIQGVLESFFLCHCKYCQKDTGSAHSANLFSTNAKLIWNKGQDHVRTFNLPQTRHVKSFCVNCGSALPSAQNEGSLIAIPAGCLDTTVELKLIAHIFTASKASWECDLELVKKFESFPF